MKPSEQLRAAARLIDTPEKWTRWYYAKDKHGNPLFADELNYGVCFCAVGAIAAAANSTFCEATGSDAYEYLRGWVGHRVQYWNDAPGRTHTEVLDAFERAAQLAESEGQ